MSNPAFIIDGYTEKNIVHALCPGQPIRRTDLNGRDASIKAIAKKIASLIRTLGNRYYPIVILIDKESRRIPLETVVILLRQGLEEEGIRDQDLRIGVADRMIENWIIADWNSFAGDKKKPKNSESSNAASLIRRVKGSYDKTTDGVELFLNADQKKIYASSPSYKYFIDQLQGIECNYLQFEK